MTLTTRKRLKAQAVEIPPTQPEKKKKHDELYAYVKDLASLSAALFYLAEAGNDRLTINQAAFFLIVAAAEARGVPVTLKEVMEATDGVLGQSIKNTYKVMLEAEGRQPKTNSALGWLKRELDLDDERRKYLRLTPKGRSVAKAALLALGKSTYGANGGTTEEGDE
jgi:hypothetical protein